jgi:poly(A) polymerase
MTRQFLPDPLAVARDYFAARGIAAYLVGGQLRDTLLGRPTADTDVAVAEGAVAHARAIAASSGGAFVALDLDRDVGRVVWPRSGVPQEYLDVARFTGPDLASDLRGRDFTVNALALPLAVPLLETPAAEGDLAVLRQAVIDPTGGLADLDARRIRMTCEGALDADPLRLLRAVRLAAELGFEIDAATADAIRARAPTLRLSAGERVREELLRILAAEGSARQVRHMVALGLLEYVLPEVAAGHGVQQSPPHDRDVFEHTLGVLAGVERIQGLLASGSAADIDPSIPLSIPPSWDDVLLERRDDLAAHFAENGGPGAAGRVARLRLAALAHDIGKPVMQRWDPERGRYRFIGHDQVGTDLVRAVATRLRLPSSDATYLETIVLHHMRPLHLMLGDDLSDRAVYRYFLATGPIGVDIAVLTLADNAAKSGRREEETVMLARVVRRLLAAWFDDHGRVVAPPALVSGHDLMAELGLGPGPDVGRLLAAIREAQAAGEIDDSAGALALARELSGSQS